MNEIERVFSMKKNWKMFFNFFHFLVGTKVLEIFSKSVYFSQNQGK